MGYLPYVDNQSFTPTIIGLTSPGVGTYTVQQGYYNRTGNLLTVQGTMSWTAHTGTGIMAIDNMPFPCRNIANYNPEGIANPQNIILPGGGITTLSSIEPNTSIINIYCVNNAGSNLNITMQTSGTMHFSIAYLI